VVDHRQAQAAAGLVGGDLDLHLAVTAVFHGVVQQGPQDLVGLVEFRRSRAVRLTGHARASIGGGTVDVALKRSMNRLRLPLAARRGQRQHRLGRGRRLAAAADPSEQRQRSGARGIPAQSPRRLDPARRKTTNPIAPPRSTPMITGFAPTRSDIACPDSRISLGHRWIRA
jgi:hypothetical protein